MSFGHLDIQSFLPTRCYDRFTVLWLLVDGKYPVFCLFLAGSFSLFLQWFKWWAQLDDESEESFNVEKTFLIPFMPFWNLKKKTEILFFLLNLCHRFACLSSSSNQLAFSFSLGHFTVFVVLLSEQGSRCLLVYGNYLFPIELTR